MTIDEFLAARVFKPDAQPDGAEKFIIRHEHSVGLLIYQSGISYPIPHERMNTPEKVLGWVFHLCSKGNVTKNHIRYFIEAADELGVHVDFNA